MEKASLLLSDLSLLVKIDKIFSYNTLHLLS